MKFRAVDRILSWEAGRRISGRKAVSFEEYLLKERMGDLERLPESLVLQSLLELGSWLVVLTSDFEEMGLVSEVGTVRFLAPLGPGLRMRIEIAVKTYETGLVRLDATADAEGYGDIVRADGVVLRRLPLADYADPDDFRMLFSEIHS